MDTDNPIIAIDFGSSYSRIGIWKDNKVNIISNKIGEKEIPSYITILDDEILVGYLSKIQSVANPRRTIFNFKRLIGYINVDDINSFIEYSHLRPYKINSTYINNFSNNRIKYEIITYHKHQKIIYVIEELISLIFEKIKKRVKKYIGKEIKNIIITIPAQFDFTQKQILKDSAAIAGLNIVRFITESTAVGISYFFEKNFENEKKVMIFNLGADFLSISVFVVKNGEFKVVAEGGKNRYGGQDFEDAIMKYFIEKYPFLKNVHNLNKFRKLCEKAKIELSKSNDVDIQFHDIENFDDIKEHFTREDFENICNFDIIKRQIEIVLIKAHMSTKDIDQIVLSGGSVNIRKIQKIISEYFDGKPIEVCPNNEEAAIIGTTIYSAYLTKQENEKIKNNNLSLPLLITNKKIKDVNEITKDKYEFNILPSNKKIIFDTANETETSLTLFISDLIDINIINDDKYEFLCKVSFDFLSHNKSQKDKTEIEVIFNTDINYNITINAKEKINNRDVNIITNYNNNNKLDKICRLSTSQLESLINKQELKVKKLEIKNIDKYLVQDSNKNNKNIVNGKFDEDDNYITCSFLINPEDLYKNINIISSYEEYLRNYHGDLKFIAEDATKFNNEDEIKNNCRIRINNKLIPFSYYYNFKENGFYSIKYSFKKNLTKTDFLFFGCFKCVTLESTLDLTHFKSENVINMSHMFDNIPIKEINFSNFNSKNVTDMSYMFHCCTNLAFLDLTNFYTEKVTNMNHMMFYCKSLLSIKFPNSFITKNVTDMNSMFDSCESLQSLDLSCFNTEKVTDMSKMFFNCKSLKSLDLSNFNTQYVTNMCDMFYSCESLISLNLSSFNTQNVTNMGYMLSRCRKMKSFDLSCFNTQNVTNMEHMFASCNSLISLDLSNFNTQNVINMKYMFFDCESLTSINLSSFNTKYVTSMDSMFSCDSSLTSLNLSNFVSNNTASTNSMFNDCTSLKSVDLSNFNINNVLNKKDMFENCKLKSKKLLKD